MLRKSICHPLISLFRVRNIVINNAQSVTDLIPKNVKGIFETYFSNFYLKYVKGHCFLHKFTYQFNCNSIPN